MEGIDTDDRIDSRLLYYPDEMRHIDDPFFQKRQVLLCVFIGKGDVLPRRQARPCIFKALIVESRLKTLGLRPLTRHFTFQNFSNPISAAKTALCHIVIKKHLQTNAV